MESLINSFGRKCSTCVHWTLIMAHTGYCSLLGRHEDLRMCYQDKEHVLMKCKTSDFSLCDLHETLEEHRLRMHKEFKENPDKFEPKH